MDSKPRIIKKGNCTARVWVTNLTPEVKRHFNEALGQELIKAYNERGMNHGELQRAN